MLGTEKNYEIVLNVVRRVSHSKAHRLGKSINGIYMEGHARLAAEAMNP